MKKNDVVILDLHLIVALMGPRTPGIFVEENENATTIQISIPKNIARNFVQPATQEDLQALYNKNIREEIK